MSIVSSKASSDALKDTVRQLVRALAGRASTNAVVQGVQLRIGVAALAGIQRDFITKSRGGMGEDGIQWAPLKKSTIAGRRFTRAEFVPVKNSHKRRSTLTPFQEKLWRKTFAQTKAFLVAKFGMEDRAASAIAGGKAWEEVKKIGAKTKLEILGSRKVDILRDTGELLRSFSPGVENRPSNADGQVFRTPPGEVVVGTNKKPWHHNKRPFWRHDGNLPASHWSAILGAANRGVAEAVAMLAKGGAP